MQSPTCYREQAARARRLANSINHLETRAALMSVACDYDQIAVDLERGLIDIPHPSRLPQHGG